MRVRLPLHEEDLLGRDVLFVQLLGESVARGSRFFVRLLLGIPLALFFLPSSVFGLSLFALSPGLVRFFGSPSACLFPPMRFVPRVGAFLGVLRFLGLPLAFLSATVAVVSLAAFLFRLLGSPSAPFLMLLMARLSSIRSVLVLWLLAEAGGELAVGGEGGGEGEGGGGGKRAYLEEVDAALQT